MNVAGKGEEKSGGSTQLCQFLDAEAVTQLHHHIQRAPEVCHLVLKEASTKGKTSFENLEN